jgi:hypothetical protein
MFVWWLWSARGLLYAALAAGVVQHRGSYASGGMLDGGPIRWCQQPIDVAKQCWKVERLVVSVERSSEG